MSQLIMSQYAMFYIPCVLGRHVSERYQNVSQYATSVSPAILGLWYTMSYTPCLGVLSAVCFFADISPGRNNH